MLQSVHVGMMREALGDLFGARALEVMIRANIGVDALWNQLGRHELHFDANAFAEAEAYLSKQRDLVHAALETGRLGEAWKAFGRLTHTAQDFYSHSNYVDLWLARQAPDVLPPAPAIEPLDETITGSTALRSGRVNLFVEALTYLPWVGPWFRMRAPGDSHARMNLDSAARGPMFPYAFQAGVKRTRHEYDALARTLTPPQLRAFRDLTD